MNNMDHQAIDILVHVHHVLYTVYVSTPVERALLPYQGAQVHCEESAGNYASKCIRLYCFTHESQLWYLKIK